MIEVHLELKRGKYGGKRKEYRKIIKNYKEQKIVFQEEMKLDYSKLEETIAEAIKIEKERENEKQEKT